MYEPDERVQIGPIKPDLKDDYKVISKIKFVDQNNFPDEIEFNANLCSIVGSRSSGKSALLAYIAHSIDAGLTEKMIDGPGEGEDYHWHKITLDYSIEWSNGKSNTESPGKIVYVPQNYLFEKSKDVDEIKQKIEPVLFKVLPDFKTKYLQVETNVGAYNQQISDQVDIWFNLSDVIISLGDQLKNLGDKEAIKGEKAQIEAQIEELKEKNKLSDEDLKKYQKVMGEISSFSIRVKEIGIELSQIGNLTEEGFFDAFTFTLSPTSGSLPKKLQEEIKEALEAKKAGILGEINKKIISYKESISVEKNETEEKVSKLRDENKDLIDKHQKNVQLDGLVKKANELLEIMNKIENTNKEKQNTQIQLDGCGNLIKSTISQRKLLIDGLITNIDSSDQSMIQGVKFGVECGLDSIEEIAQRVNIRDKSDFIEKGQLKIDEAREKPNDFLIAVYSGKQKVIAGNDKKEVAREVLSLTEKVLFTAEMEGDKIGGFSEPTMTPGKRALFALRLILAESNDTWPLLIDQPEDDLDSRSIYDEVVPFLKEKKKERQIIMVSHNANLVIGSDSEQIIVANRNGNDRKNEDGKQFNYLTGGIEYSYKKDKTCIDTLKSQGVCQHACEILDGGKIAFDNRKNKYNLA